MVMVIGYTPNLYKGEKWWFNVFTVLNYWWTQISERVYSAKKLDWNSFILCSVDLGEYIIFLMLYETSSQIWKREPIQLSLLADSNSNRAWGLRLKIISGHYISLQ